MERLEKSMNDYEGGLMCYAILLTSDKECATTLLYSTIEKVRKNIADDKIGDVTYIDFNSYMYAVMNNVYCTNSF